MRQIFVFGSNLAGRHGKGAALEAVKKHGACYGIGEGPQGDSYAIPTKNWELKTLPLITIQESVKRFIWFAERLPQIQFNITRIGCGLAGYDWEKDIRPLFPEVMPDNCKFIEAP